MKKIRKYILAILLSGTIALLVPACGGGGSSGDGESDDNASGGSTSAENGFAPASIAGTTAICNDPSSSVKTERYFFYRDGTCALQWPSFALTGTYSYTKLSEKSAKIYVYATFSDRTVIYQINLTFSDEKNAFGEKIWTETSVNGTSRGTNTVYFTF